MSANHSRLNSAHDLIKKNSSNILVSVQKMKTLIFFMNIPLNVRGDIIGSCVLNYWLQTSLATISINCHGHLGK